MKGSHGMRRRTRNLKKGLKSRRRVSIRKYMQKFKDGDKASIVLDSSYSSLPYPKFQGKTGMIVGSQGRAYYLEIRDGGSRKRILVTPEHLKKLEA